MNLLIKGMNMPDSCRHCRFCIPTEPDCDGSPYECVLNDYLHWTTWMEVPIFVSEGCKLIKPRTPHGRLIDADALLSRLNGIKYAANVEDWISRKPIFADGLEEEIISAPTIIEAEDGE